MKEKRAKLDWEDIIMNVGQPVYDKSRKKWRVLRGYQNKDGYYYILFSDCGLWTQFEDLELYLKETE